MTGPKPFSRRQRGPCCLWRPGIGPLRRPAGRVTGDGRWRFDWGPASRRGGQGAKSIVVRWDVERNAAAPMRRKDERRERTPTGCPDPLQNAFVERITNVAIWRCPRLLRDVADAACDLDIIIPSESAAGRCVGVLGQNMVSLNSCCAKQGGRERLNRAKFLAALLVRGRPILMATSIHATHIVRDDNEEFCRRAGAEAVGSPRENQ